MALFSVVVPCVKEAQKGFARSDVMKAWLMQLLCGHFGSAPVGAAVVVAPPRVRVLVRTVVAGAVVVVAVCSLLASAVVVGADAAVEVLVAKVVGTVLESSC